jgi:hypothetical protein
MPSAPAYHRHFGSLRNAYALIGYTSPKDWGGLPASRHRLSVVTDFVARLRSAVDARAGVAEWDRHGRILTLNHRLSVAIIAASCSVVPTTGELRWKAYSGRKEHPSVTIIIRLDLSGSLRDFIFVPAHVANRYVRRAIGDAICAPYRFSSFEEVATVILLKANNPETV